MQVIIKQVKRIINYIPVLPDSNDLIAINSKIITFSKIYLRPFAALRFYIQ